MKKYILIIILFLNAVVSPGQTEYKDQYLGWIKMIKASDPVKPAQYDNRNFSAKQLAHCNLFINWIQSSYTPKGGLGEGRKLANEKLSPYNQYTRSLHPYYGAYLPTYVFLKKKPGGGWTPENNLGLFLRVIANGLLGDHVDVISSPENYYFYIPELTPQDEYAKQKSRFLGFDTHPVLSQYIHFYQPASIRYLAQYVVVLSKNNIRPWQPITKREFLEQLGKTIDRVHLEKLKKIKEDYDEKRKASFLKDEEALYKKRQQILAAQLDKYKKRLDETATIYTEQPSVHLENTADLFEGNGGRNMKIPVYKYDPAFIQQTKSDTPQWITISWGGGEMSDEGYKHMHNSMLNNIDYGYIYKYFFEPRNLQGRPYQPLRPPVTIEKMETREASAQAQKMAKEPGSVFFDDFSSTITGQSPANWKSENNSLGEPVRVEKDGDQHYSAVLKGNKITLNKKINIPADFTISCTIAVPQGFTWGAKRLSCKIGTGKVSFVVSMRPGFDGNSGFLYAGPDQYGSTILTTDGLAKANELPIPGFSNDKPLNRFRLQIRKKGTMLELLVNGQPAVQLPTAFKNAATTLEGIEFSHSRSDQDTEKYFITDIHVSGN